MRHHLPASIALFASVAIRLPGAAGFLLAALAATPAVAQSGPTVDVWYGDHQEFGFVGRHQRQVNILGTASDPDGVKALRFSLNGGSWRRLSQGPDSRRLLRAGDFNVELYFDELQEGLNDVLIRATDEFSEHTYHSVTVDVQKENRWPESWSVDWSGAPANPADSVEVVDGTWEVTPDGLRTVDVGYDRTFGAGDVTWDDFEVTVPITIHSIDPAGFEWPSVSPGLGIILHWTGHWNWDGEQPSVGWTPSGGVPWYDAGAEEFCLNGCSARSLALGTTYIWKARCETVAPGDVRYSYKVWPESEPEPAEWDETYLETADDLPRGALLFVAHHVDATFGDIVVDELPEILPPEISEISVEADSTTATIAWRTDEEADGSVSWGTGGTTELGSVSGSAGVLRHSVTLTGLTAGTTYSYQVRSTDDNGNTGETAVLQFTTDGPDTTPPALSNIAIETGADFATLTWTTDEAATSVVDWGTTTSYEGGRVEDTALVTSHSITLSGLESNVEHHARITSADADGNASSSADLVFTPEADLDPPVLSGLTASVTDGSATIEWSTDEPATSAVDWGTDTSYGQTTSDPNLQTTHTVTLTGLLAETTYHYRVRSTDAEGNEAVSVDHTFTTTAAPAGGPVSDDFSSDTLDTVLWTFIDPLGDASVLLNGTQAEITAPSGGTHDAWTSSNTLPRIVQSVGDVDFEVEAKFESPLTASFQSQGILVEESPLDVLRIEFHNWGGDTKIYVASILDGTATKHVLQKLSVPSVQWLRVARSGDTWTVRYSFDGSTWQTAATFTRALTVEGVGVYAGSSDTVSHTAVVDWFFDTAAPIDPEDPTRHTVSVSSTGGGIVTRDPEAEDYLLDSTVTLTAVPDSGWSFTGWSGDLSGTTNPVDVQVTGDLAITAEFVSDTTTTYSLSTTVTGEGSVARDPDAASYEEGTVVTLTALPASGWHFVEWTGDAAGTTNPIDVTMDQDLVIGAAFEADPDTTPPVLSDIVVTPSHDEATVSWTTDEPATSRADWGLTTSYGTSETDTTLVTSHSFVLTGLTAETTYHLLLTSVDEAGNAADSGDLLFTTEATPAGLPLSDDFSGTSLDTDLWSFVNPLDDAAASLDGSRLQIAVPASGETHDVWTSSNTLPRVMQPVGDVDFEVEAKFESPLTTSFQSQGILIEENPLDVLRVEFHNWGGDTNIYVASISGGKATTRKLQTLAVPSVQWLRVARSGDNWTVRYSFDGSNWTTAASFVDTLTPGSVGTYAGNSADVAHTALVDWFFETASPIDPEDGGSDGAATYALLVDTVGSGTVSRSPDQTEYEEGTVVELSASADPGWHFVEWTGDASGTGNPLSLTVSGDLTVTAVFAEDLDTTPPSISSVLVDPSHDSATVTWTTDEPATSRVEWGLTTSYTDFTEDLTLVTDHSVTISGLTAETSYHLVARSTDDAGNTSDSGDLVFTTAAAPVGLPVSDDFSGSTIDGSLWSFVNPLGDASLAATGTQAHISIPDTAEIHDVWTGSNTLPRLMQDVGDVDFEVEASFDSTLATDAFRSQGILVEEGPLDVVRAEFHAYGGKTKVYVATIFDGSASRRCLKSIPAASGSVQLRVGRSGDDWTVTYSLDGSSWTTCASFRQAMLPQSVGVFAGSGEGVAHDVLVDYLFETASPVEPGD